MKTKIILLFALLAALWRGAAPVGAVELAPNFIVDERGVLEIAEVKFNLVHFDANGDYAQQRHNLAKPSEKDITIDQSWDGVRFDIKSWKLHGKLQSAPALTVAEEITVTGAGVAYRAQYTNTAGADTRLAGLDLLLSTERFANSVIFLDDLRLELPTQMPSDPTLKSGRFHRITIPTEKGNLIIRNLDTQGTLAVLLQDGRKFGGKEFFARIEMTPAKGVIKEAHLDLDIALVPYQTTSIALNGAATTGFRDEVDGDQQGGWTDQGARDFRMAPLGKQVLGGVNFDIIDPAANDGKSCLVFAGPERNYLAKTATVAVDNQTFANLYLLHSFAWANNAVAGDLVVTYADGAVQKIPVQCGKDAGNWLTADYDEFANGRLVWRDSATGAGLFLSRFAVAAKPIKEIRFDASGKVVWMVVGLAGGDEIPIIKELPVLMTAGRDWVKLDAPLLPEENSALDFSFLLDAPAGKYGRVLIKNGHYEFENRPNEPVRFYGTNTCFNANFQSKENTDAMIEQLARQGYNALRIHHYDTRVGSAKNSAVVEGAALDQLDYLFAAAKKRGLYITIDLYTVRETRVGEVPTVNDGAKIGADMFKALVAINDAVFENWAAFSRNLLEHVNPYTGLTWKDDPALYSICMVNEGNLNTHWMKVNLTDPMKTAFTAWLAAKKIPEPQNAAARDLLFYQFVNTDLQIAHAKRCVDFLRNELGVKAHLTNLNMFCFPYYGLVRDTFDFTDQHLYYGGGRRLQHKWLPPLVVDDGSATQGAAYSPRYLMTSRMLDQPFAVTEWNYSPPNSHRAEGGPLMGAYAAFQDWDALYRFAYSHDQDNTRAPMIARDYDTATDPLARLSERIGLLFFLRRDVAPAKTVVPFIFSEKCMDDPDVFLWARERPDHRLTVVGLLAKTGGHSVAFGKKLPRTYPAVFGIEDFSADDARLADAKYFKLSDDLLEQLAGAGAIKREQFKLDGKNVLDRARYTNDTGEITVDTTRGTLRVATARGECFVLPAGEAEAGAVMTAENKDAFVTVAAHALDDQPLASSKKIVLFHLTNLRNTNQKYRDNSMRIMEDWGEMPYLARRGETVITLALSDAAAAKIWALDLAGRRVREMPSEYRDGKLVFTANTAQEGGAIFAYEITR
jgi:hypothetical protein